MQYSIFSTSEKLLPERPQSTLGNNIIYIFTCECFDDCVLVALFTDNNSIFNSLDICLEALSLVGGKDSFERECGAQTITSDLGERKANEIKKVHFQHANKCSQLLFRK